MRTKWEWIGLLEIVFTLLVHLCDAAEDGLEVADGQLTAPLDFGAGAFLGEAR